MDKEEICFKAVELSISNRPKRSITDTLEDATKIIEFVMPHAEAKIGPVEEDEEAEERFGVVFRPEDYVTEGSHFPEVALKYASVRMLLVELRLRAEIEDELGHDVTAERLNQSVAQLMKHLTEEELNRRRSNVQT